MPMFFILSTMTYKLSADREQWVRKTERAFMHLILPMLGVYAFITIINIARHFNNIQPVAFMADRINALIYASGVDVKVGSTIVQAIGVLVFLLALF